MFRCAVELVVLQNVNVGHDRLIAGAPNAKVALLRWQNIKVKNARVCVRSPDLR